MILAGICPDNLSEYQLGAAGVTSADNNRELLLFNRHRNKRYINPLIRQRQSCRTRKFDDRYLCLNMYRGDLWVRLEVTSQWSKTCRT